MLVQDNIGESALEKYLPDVMRQLNLKGYSTKSHMKIEGRSGVTHDVDLLVEDGDSKMFIVQYVSSDTLIEEKDVVKLFTISFDINARGVLMIVDRELTANAADLSRVYYMKTLNVPDADRLPEILEDLVKGS